MKTIPYLIGLSSLTLWANAGFFASENGSPRSAPQIQSAEIFALATSPADLQLSFTSDSIGAVYGTLFGNNLNGWMGKSPAQNTRLLSNLRSAGVSILRLPGGSWSDNWMWDGSTPTNVADRYDTTVYSSKNWTVSTEEQARIADSLGIPTQPIVNYALARYYNGADRASRAAAYAAAWVKDFNINKKRGVKYWEVGNECFGNWEAGYKVSGLDTINGTQYGNDFKLFADSMKAVDPSIHVGCVVSGINNGDSYSGFNWWTQKVLNSAGSKCDYLINHEYFTWNNDPNKITATQVMASLPMIGREKKTLDSMSLALTGKIIPVAQTEYNFRAGRKQASFLAVAFTTSALMEYAKNDYGLVNLWDVTNAYDSVSGDMGMLSRSNPKLPDYSPQSYFYSYWLAHQFMGHKILKSTLSGDSSNLHLLVTAFTDSSYGIVAVNSGAQNKVLALEAAPISQGQLLGYRIQADSLAAPTFKVNGIGPSQPGSVGPELYQNINAIGSQWKKGDKLDLPPFSANYFLLSKSSAQLNVPAQFKSSTQFSYSNRTLHLSGMQGQTTAQIVNLKGETLRTLNTDQSEAKWELGLAPASYWLILQQNQVIYRFQFQVQS